MLTSVRALVLALALPLAMRWRLIAASRRLCEPFLAHTLLHRRVIYERITLTLFLPHTVLAFVGKTNRERDSFRVVSIIFNSLI